MRAAGDAAQAAASQWLHMPKQANKQLVVHFTHMTFSLVDGPTVRFRYDHRKVAHSTIDITEPGAVETEEDGGGSDL